MKRRLGIVSDLERRNPFSGMGVYISGISQGLRKSLAFEIAPIYLDLGSPPFESIFVQFKVWWAIYRHKLDIIYYPNPPIPVFTPIPNILTIPDLSFVFDQTYPLFVKVYLWATYFLAAHSAQAITTFSSASSRDIASHLFVSAKKIHIISPFINAGFYELPKLTEQIILAVPGTFVTRKNISDLLNVYAKLSLQLRKKYRLVVVGKKDNRNFPKIAAQCDQLGLTNQVKFTGNVSSSEILALYQKSIVLVCTSLYEGFGLPCVEAFAAGVPVIAYDNSSLSEVVGNAGILVTNSTTLKSALEKLLTSKNLRAEYSARGRTRAKMFSSSESSRKLLELLDYVCIHR